ncbi:inward rectifier K channel (IRK-C) family protein, partial [Thraustotheca clavata]
MLNFGDWQRTWLGISIPEVAASGLFGPSNVFTGIKRHGRHFFGKRIEWVNGKPRSIYKDLVYMLLNMTWFRLWFVLTIFYFLLTAFFGFFFYYLCGECNTPQEGYNMSYQALSTIGFGIVYPMHRCGNYVIVLEAFTSILLLPAIGGLIFSKFSIPKISVAFSRVAVITPDYVNGQPALVIRCANPTHSTQVNKDVLLDVTFEAELHRTEKMWGSDELILKRFQLPLQQSNFIFFRFAVELVHIIDANSPLRGLIDEIQKPENNFVLHVTMQGVDSSRHLTIYDQHMYTQRDIQSGFRFKQMLETQPGAYMMNFNLLDAIEIAPMALNDPIKPTRSLTEETSVSTRSSFLRQNSDNSPHHHVDMTIDVMMHDAPGEMNEFMRPSISSHGTIQEGYAAISEAPLHTSVIQSIGIPFSTQYFYHHILGSHWLPIILVIAAVFLCLTFIFATLHWLRFHQGLYVMPGLADHISPYELSFFLSIHTMSTIGYGNIGPSENDLYHNGVTAAEAIIGLTFSAIFTGICWSKFAKPRAHVQFSSSLVVTTIEGQRCIMVRA